MLGYSVALSSYSTYGTHKALTRAFGIVHERNIASLQIKDQTVANRRPIFSLVPRRQLGVYRWKVRRSVGVRRRPSPRNDPGPAPAP